MKRAGRSAYASSVVMSLLATTATTIASGAFRRAGASAATGRAVRASSSTIPPGAAFLYPSAARCGESFAAATPPGASVRRRGSTSSSFRLFSTTDSPRKSGQQQQPPRTVHSPFADDDVDSILISSGYNRPLVNWYPGHIAKAERLLSETLKSVDVVVEVRDARCPKATAHPRVAEWSAGRPRVVVLTHADAVTSASRGSWKKAYEELGAGRWDGSVDGQVRNAALQAWRERKRWKSAGDGSSGGKKGGRKSEQQQIREDLELSSQVEDVLFVDAKRGAGVRGINRAVLRAGAHVNERRARRGLNERPLRVGVIGYPNVGKSALINKILGRRRARTANTPGVTRSLQWIRVRSDDNKKQSRGKEFELLDSPGIIPAHMADQSDALLLAACNSVGDAAYDNQAVAAYLCEWIKTLHVMGRGEMSAPQWREKCKKRYGFDPLVPQPVSVIGTMPGQGQVEERLPTGEDILFLIADRTCQGNPEDAARKILQDFRSGRMGPAALQLAPRRADDGGQTKVDVRRGVAESLGGDLAERASRSAEERRREEMEERDRRAKVAVETAAERGLELPPVVEASAEEGAEEEETGEKEDSAPEVSQEEIGKGMFDGW